MGWRYCFLRAHANRSHLCLRLWKVSASSHSLALRCDTIKWLRHSQCAPRKSSVAWSVFFGLKVYKELKSIEDFQHNMGTVLYHGEVYTNGSRNSNKVGRAWRTRKEQDAHPHPLLTATLRTTVPWFWKTDKWLLMKWQTILKLVMVLHDIIHNRLGFHKVCARWVPKELTEEHRNNRVAICQRLLDRYANEGKALWHE